MVDLSAEIAKSKNLMKWEKTGVVTPTQECDAKSLATGDLEMKIWMQVLASAPLHSDYGKML